MGTLTALMSATSSALASDQKALEVTAQNISNQNTDGYSRKVVNWSEADTVNFGGVNLGEGTYATVSSTRDGVLAQSVQQATDTAAASSARSVALNDLQGVFSLNSSGTDGAGIETGISGFFNALNTLSASPSDTSASQAVFSAAQTLAGNFNRAASVIGAQQISLDETVASAVPQMNALLQQIAGVNGAIGRSAPGTDISNLLDQRDSLVTKLSTYMDVSQTQNSNDGITLTTSNGTLLMSGSTADPLTTANIGGVTHLFAASSASGLDITAQIGGGSVGGAIQARDTDIPAVIAQLNSLAASIADAVNTQNAAGLTSTGSPGGAIFSYSTAAGAAATMTVSASGPDAIASAAVSEGVNGGSNAASMAALANAATMGTQTFAGSFTATLTQLGSTAAAASNASTYDAAALSQLSAQRDAISGVSLDTEAANLTQYERSYEAAAKVLSIVNTVLASALNLGTETTVS